jgi:hypothetical protein
VGHVQISRIENGNVEPHPGTVPDALMEPDTEQGKAAA